MKEINEINDKSIVSESENLVKERAKLLEQEVNSFSFPASLEYFTYNSKKDILRKNPLLLLISEVAKSDPCYALNALEFLFNRTLDSKEGEYWSAVTFCERLENKFLDIIASSIERNLKLSAVEEIKRIVKTSLIMKNCTSYSENEVTSMLNKHLTGRKKSEMITLANDGNVKAQIECGDYLSSKKNYSEAFNCYMLAANQGETNAKEKILDAAFLQKALFSATQKNDINTVRLLLKYSGSFDLHAKDVPFIGDTALEIAQKNSYGEIQNLITKATKIENKESKSFNWGGLSTFFRGEDSVIENSVIKITEDEKGTYSL